MVKHTIRTATATMATSDEPDIYPRPVAERQPASARERTRAATAAGDYDALLDPAHWRLLEAAATAEPDGFHREIGALRVVMARCWPRRTTPPYSRPTFPA